MKLKLAFLALTIVAAGGWFFMPEHSPLPRPKAPNFSITAGVELYDLPAEETWVHFWASWCPPCVVEIPKLLKEFKEDKDKTLVLVSLDKSEDAMNAFLDKQPEDSLYSAHILTTWDEGGQIADLYQSYQYPETYILNEEFELVRKIKGEALK
ncbi:MAG: TlpA disulfide reductase family protein [Alphaproteobacteria bacterium]|nr:TlpA disulfide reductase family protein [Alphaproteobacteria bacterium]